MTCAIKVRIDRDQSGQMPRQGAGKYNSRCNILQIRDNSLVILCQVNDHDPSVFGGEP
jgi:hypothetical protein